MASELKREGVDFVLRSTVMLEGDAGSIAADTRRFFSRQRVENAAARGERQRVGRELHDGALQALTGVSLQLSALGRLIETDPQAAVRQVDKLVTMVAAEQRALREWLAQEGEPRKVAMASAAELACALEHLCRQAEAQWGLRVELREGPQRMIPRAVADHVYRIIQEAVANAGKHARAAHASVRLRLGVDALTVTVADDGVGFPFRGQYDLQTLRERGIGPRSLRERVASLRGQMTLTSTMSGSTVEIVLPLTTRPSGPLG